jgi:hypothetical protein
MPDDWNEDMKRGLAVIAASDSLSGHHRVRGWRSCRHPGSTRSTCWHDRRIAGVETSANPNRECAGRQHPRRFGAQQLLINLVHNASDAALQTGGGVRRLEA